MAKRARVANRTEKMIKELDVLVNKNGLVYNVASDLIVATSPQGLSKSITSTKAGGQKEMFYAAAGIRNYMTKHGKKPDAKATQDIIGRAQKAESTRGEWEAKYIQNRDAKEARMQAENNVEPTVRKRPGIQITPKVTETISVDTPQKAPSRAGRKKESFETILNKSIKKGTITLMSGCKKNVSADANAAKAELEEMGLDIDHRYFTRYKKTPQRDLEAVVIRITPADSRKLSISVNKNSFNTIEDMYNAASDIRTVMLRTGKLPTEKVRADIYAENGATKKPHKMRITKDRASASVRKRPTLSSKTPATVQSEKPTNPTVLVTEPATPEQEPKLRTKGIFTRAKMWLFGE